jgi:hypothetical protein
VIGSIFYVKPRIFGNSGQTKFSLLQPIYFLHSFFMTGQAKKGFATDEVSFLSLFIIGTYDIGGGWGVKHLEERRECSAGYGITEM